MSVDRHLAANSLQDIVRLTHRAYWLLPLRAGLGLIVVFYLLFTGPELEILLLVLHFILQFSRCRLDWLWVSDGDLLKLVAVVVALDRHLILWIVLLSVVWLIVDRAKLRPCLWQVLVLIRVRLSLTAGSATGLLSEIVLVRGHATSVNVRHVSEVLNWQCRF